MNIKLQSSNGLCEIVDAPSQVVDCGVVIRGLVVYRYRDARRGVELPTFEEVAWLRLDETPAEGGSAGRAAVELARTTNSVAALRVLQAAGYDRVVGGAPSPRRMVTIDHLVSEILRRS